MTRPAFPERRWRPGYAALAAIVLLAEIGIALFVRDRWVRPHGGDVLAVILVYVAVRAVTRWSVGTASAVALGIAVAVELGQYVGILRIVGLDHVPVVRVVMGTGFDPADFVSYGIGGAIVVIVEWLRRR